VRAIVQRQYVRVKEYLTRDREKLQRLADALMERETLDAEEIAAVLDGRELPKRDRVIIPTYAEKDKQSKEKRRVASIFGGPPKPATSGS
jgi:cell division protease FtsH